MVEKETTKMIKMWTKEEIKEKLLNDDRWLLRAVLAIYERQTFDEQVEHDTKYRNGIGFNSADAGFLTYSANLLKSGHVLYPKRLAATRRKMLKYVKQLAEIANASPIVIHRGQREGQAV